MPLGGLIEVAGPIDALLAAKAAADVHKVRRRRLLVQHIAGVAAEIVAVVHRRGGRQERVGRMRTQADSVDGGGQPQQRCRRCDGQQHLVDAGMKMIFCQSFATTLSQSNFMFIAFSTLQMQ